MRYFIAFRPIWLFSGLAVLLLVSACGGDDDASGSDTPATAVVCDGLAQKSYSYTSLVVTTVEEGSTPAPTGVVAGPPPFSFSQQANGEVEDGVDMSTHILNTDGLNKGEYDTIDLDGHAYVNRGDGWQDQGTEPRFSLIQFKPWSTCDALVEDIALADLAGTSEKVDNVDATRYEVSLPDSQFAARHPDLGPGHDVASYIKSYTGTVWVANDGYIAKLDLQGAGEYPDGKPIKIHLTYEVADVDSDISVDAPI